MSGLLIRVGEKELPAFSSEPIAWGSERIVMNIWFADILFSCLLFYCVILARLRPMNEVAKPHSCLEATLPPSCTRSFIRIPHSLITLVSIPLCLDRLLRILGMERVIWFGLNKASQLLLAALVMTA